MNDATLQVIDLLDLIMDIPKLGVLLALPGYALTDEMEDDHQFEGTVSIEFADGRTASYPAVFEVVPEVTSELAAPIPRRLGALIRCDESGRDLVGAAYDVHLTQRIEGFKLQT